jgi:hypothetical protein
VLHIFIVWKYCKYRESSLSEIKCLFFSQFQRVQLGKIFCIHIWQNGLRHSIKKWLGLKWHLKCTSLWFKWGRQMDEGMLEVIENAKFQVDTDLLLLVKVQWAQAGWQKMVTAFWDMKPDSGRQEFSIPWSHKWRVCSEGNGKP